MMASAKISEAREHCKAAERATRTGMFRWKADFDSAADEYSQAAQCYRIARDLPNSKECHLKASECYKKNNAFFHAAKALENAIIVSKEIAPPEEIYNLAVESASLYQQHGSGDSGASVLDKAAKILEEKDLELAVKLFTQAADVSSRKFTYKSHEASAMQINHLITYYDSSNPPDESRLLKAAHIAVWNKITNALNDVWGTPKTREEWMEITRQLKEYGYLEHRPNAPFRDINIDEIRVPEIQQAQEVAGAAGNDAPQQMPSASVEEPEASAEATATTEATATAEDMATTEAAATAEDMATTEDAATTEDMATTEDTATTEDMATTEGAATAENMATTEDAATAEDMATTEDTATAEDMATTEDAAMAEDMATTEDAAKADGMATTEDAATAEGMATTEDAATAEDMATAEDTASADEMDTAEDTATAEETASAEPAPKIDPFHFYGA